MEEPNFERIKDSIVSASAEVYQLESVWIKLKLGKLDNFSSASLEELLKEYNLEMLISDFLLLGHFFSEHMKKVKPSNQQIKNNTEIELLQTLNLLLNNNEGIKIDFYKKSQHEATIQDKILIKFIKEGLLEYLKRRYSSSYDWNYLDIDKDWEKYIKDRLLELKKESRKRGRPNENRHLINMIFSLWKYLQNYTELKADEGKTYSNRQAKFIFQFLKIHALINQSISNEKDIIGYYLKTYVKTRKRYVQLAMEASKSRDLKKEMIEKEEFLTKYENDYRLSLERKEQLQRDIKNLKNILIRRNKL